MPGKSIKLRSEGIMSSMRLGVAVTGLYSLVTMGLMIVFLRGAPKADVVLAADDVRFRG